MGYEVKYYYHERTDDGYNKDETKELKKPVGSVYEDVPLEKLATAVMSQLARRDIWVTNVEIHEFKKQKISFRETKGGIVIKNKKFSLDNEANIVMQEEQPVAPPVQVPQHQQLQPQHAPALPKIPQLKIGENPPANVPAACPYETPQQAPAGRPIKYVTLDTSRDTLMAIRKKGLRFTPDKRYPVYAEKPDPQTGIMVFAMVDDLGRQLNVTNDYFVPEANLEFDNEIGFTEPSQGKAKLMYQDQMDSEPEMIDIRR